MKHFNERLLLIFEKYSLNASTFADKIGVQRSSLSHILSGRNKPSLDFVLKICDTFPEVDLRWLTLGKGNFSFTDKIISSPILEKEIDSEEIKNEFDIKKENLFDFENKPKEEIDINSDMNKKNENKSDFINLLTKNVIGENEIEQIIIFYKDGSFKNYIPK